MERGEPLFLSLNTFFLQKFTVGRLPPKDRDKLNPKVIEFRLRCVFVYLALSLSALSGSLSPVLVPGLRFCFDTRPAHGHTHTHTVTQDTHTRSGSSLSLSLSLSSLVAQNPRPSCLLTLAFLQLSRRVSPSCDFPKVDNAESREVCLSFLLGPPLLSRLCLSAILNYSPSYAPVFLEPNQLGDTKPTVKK